MDLLIINLCYIITMYININNSSSVNKKKNDDDDNNNNNNNNNNDGINSNNNMNLKMKALWMLKSSKCTWSTNPRNLVNLVTLK